MKKRDRDEGAIEMRSRYDFSGAIKNPYASRFAKGSNIVMIKPQLFAAFPSEQAVNDALETLLETGLKVTKSVLPPKTSKPVKAS